MTAERWAKVKQLFAEAMALPAAEREAWLQNACGQDSELLTEVLGMLSAAAEAGTFLNTPDPVGGGEPPRGDLSGRVLDEFELLDEIGRGGMGVVYRARQISLDRKVAIKVLPASPLLTQRTIDRFRREAQAAGKLIHPAITPVHAVGQDGDLHWFAMEYVAGHDLRRELELLSGSMDSGGESPFLPGPRSRHFIGAVVGIIEEVARALHHAHEHGIVHRDVKPHNILLDRAGHPHVVDFGLAKDESLGSLTATGDVAGTPHYMSPEQVRRGSARVDHRTDIFSLGVVLYELLTLRRPFEGRTSQAVFDSITQREHPPARRVNPRVPRDLQTVCDKALSKSVERRYATAADLADDLRRFLDHQAILARPAGALERAWRVITRHRLVSVAASLGILGTLAGLWVGDALATDRHATERVHALTDLLQEEDWESPAVLGRLSEARRVQALIEADSSASAEARDSARRFDQRLETLRVTWLQRLPEVLDDIASHWDPSRVRTDASRGDSPGRAPSTLAQVALLFPEDAALHAATSYDVLLPRLSVDADRRDAQVWVSRFDPLSGEPGVATQLGYAPIREQTLAPGVWRIEVRSPGFGSAEFDRVIDTPSSTTLLRASLRPDGNVLPGMVSVPAGVLRPTAGAPLSDSDQQCFLQQDEIAVAGFLLDRHEVSNGQFREFVAARGGTLPSHWPPPQSWDPAWDELPVTFIDFELMRAYAEWAGKRLPTHHEWELAARLADRRLYPWGDDPRLGQPVCNTEGVQLDYSANLDVWWASYVAATRPVNSDDGAGHPLGLVHLLGNVLEWTSSPVFVSASDGPGLMAVTGTRWTLGGAWHHRRQDHSLADHRQASVLPGYRMIDQGFRCAKGAAP